MGQALYRKYRSKSLAEIIGQEHITETLERAITNGRVSHAYLFTGPRGTGKTSVARILAHQINQLPYSDETHLDIIEIDAASNRRIDDIRDLRDKVHIAPASANYKVYIVDEVHMLTGESFNALLKTLEEPPAHVVFILATTEVHKLPATIISRTQRYNFRPMDLEKGAKHLRDIATKEKIDIDDEALGLIAEHGAGSFRDSVSLLDQLANVSQGKITPEVIEQNLGLAPRAVIAVLLEALISKDHKAIVAKLDELATQGATTAALLPQLIRALQASAHTHSALYQLIDQLVEVPRAYSPQIKLLTTLVGFALSDQKQAPTKHTPAIVESARPVLEVTATPKSLATPKPAAKPKAGKKPPKPEEPIETVESGARLSELTLEQWGLVLGKVKEVSAPLQAVLRHGEPAFDAEDQVLTLKFRYPLHRKRLEEAKARLTVAKAMLGALGGAPTIKTEINAEANPPQVEAVPPKAPLDEAAQSVAELMGGGEAVAA